MSLKRSVILLGSVFSGVRSPHFLCSQNGVSVILKITLWRNIILGSCLEASEQLGVWVGGGDGPVDETLQNGDSLMKWR